MSFSLNESMFSKMRGRDILVVRRMGVVDGVPYHGVPCDGVSFHGVPYHDVPRRGRSACEKQLLYLIVLEDT